MANKYTALKIDVDQAISLYEQGYSQTEVGVALGTTQKVIHDRLKKAGYVCRIAKKRNQRGSQNDSWKGDDADYKALHIRVAVARGQPQWCAMCERTDRKRYEWASIRGRYHDVYDYIRLCKSCHSKFDDMTKNFLKGGDAP